MAPPSAPARPWVYISVFLLAIGGVIFAQDLGLIDDNVAAITVDSAWVLHIAFLAFMILTVAVPSN